ncbi:hypothetical protein CS537_06140 [Yersinia mollaretii]|nr:hypothetical protein CS537_06140 [Yersinia mollaretii]
MMYKFFRADARRLTISLIIINSYQQEEQVFLVLLFFFDLYYLFYLDKLISHESGNHSYIKFNFNLHRKITLEYNMYVVLLADLFYIQQ